MNIDLKSRTLLAFLWTFATSFVSSNSRAYEVICRGMAVEVDSSQLTDENVRFCNGESATSKKHKDLSWENSRPAISPPTPPAHSPGGPPDGLSVVVRNIPEDLTARLFIVSWTKRNFIYDSPATLQKRSVEDHGADQAIMARGRGECAAAGYSECTPSDLYVSETFPASGCVNTLGGFDCTGALNGITGVLTRSFMGRNSNRSNPTIVGKSASLCRDCNNDPLTQWKQVFEESKPLDMKQLKMEFGDSFCLRGDVGYSSIPGITSIIALSFSGLVPTIHIEGAQSDRRCHGQYKMRHLNFSNGDFSFNGEMTASHYNNFYSSYSPASNFPTSIGIDSQTHWMTGPQNPSLPNYRGSYGTVYQVTIRRRGNALVTRWQLISHDRTQAKDVLYLGADLSTAKAYK